MSRLLGIFISLPGVFVLAALDSTIFFTLPFGIDAVVVLLAARHHRLGWAVAAVATAGSLIGAWLTYRVGAALGDTGVARYVLSRRLTELKRRVQNSAVVMAMLDFVPPPFPFSVFVLSAGAAQIDRRRFFVTLAMCRLVRFGGETLVGAKYGSAAVRWEIPQPFQTLILGVVAVALTAALISLMRLIRSMRVRGAKGLAPALVNEAILPGSPSGQTGHSSSRSKQTKL